VSAEARQWAFVSSHGLVLLEVARNPDLTVRQIGQRVELTERQAHRVLTDLINDGYVVKQRAGRRNHYRVVPSLPMRRAANAARPIGELLRALTS
jgi:DNA-binding MarR family transcriptional regulator